MIEFLLGICFCLFAKRGKGGGLMGQLVGYGARSPVSVACTPWIAPAPYSRTFPFCTVFLKFCVECER
ncbi:hypothetical protein [Microcoleus sp. AR_TQ3_B6]|uniref:hypothetical protein n=1 Tax=Microcoleus sp. AR_TQ3_B6 TaxID=3055284 RepID=UPI002FCFB8AF